MIVQQFIALFAEMDVLTVACLAIGLVFAVAEIFQPGFKVYGVLGGILLVTGAVLRISKEEGDGAFAMFFILTFIIAVILFLAFFIMVQTARRGWLFSSRERGNVKNTSRKSNVDYSHLIGKLGVASTQLRPSGKAEIEAEIYPVSADGFFISRGEVVRVTGVDGESITVRRADI